MARKYVQVRIQMIADMTPGTGQLIQDDITELLLGMDAIEAGEVAVEVIAREEVRLLPKRKGDKLPYADPWPYEDKIE